MHKEKILITGILGFIGFHAAKKLCYLGYTVVGIDNLNDYYDQRLKVLRLEVLKKLNIDINFLDISDEKSLTSFISINKPKKILHLAAQAGVRYSFENPTAYIKSNISGFFNLLEAVKNFATPIVYASSSSVYGGNAKIPFCENDMTDSPLNLYAATKKSNELFAHSYHHLYNIPLIGLRFFTVYGPYGRPDMAYFSFTKKILDSIPIQVFSNGQLKRDFTYIDDIIDGITTALSFPVDYGIFNLGNHEPVKVKDMISLLEIKLGKKAIVEEVKTPSTEVEVTFADIKKSHEILGYVPKTSLSIGLDNFIDWYQKEYVYLRPLEESKKLHPEFFP